jgi:hypothetical protein
MLETLLGGLFGGALRLAPELLKLWDRKSEREHELKMLTQEQEFAKTRAEIQLRNDQVALDNKQFTVLDNTLVQQTELAKSSGWLIAGINALVRPTTTYLFLAGYFLVKFAMYSLAVAQSAHWDLVVISLWTADDTTILFMIISFWFVGRVYDNKAKP